MYLRRLGDAYLEEVMPLKEYQERQKGFREREKELLLQLAELQAQQTQAPLSPDKLASVLADLRAAWGKWGAEEKKAFLQLFVQRIVIDTPYQKMPKSRAKQVIVFRDILFK